jgi:hypothetical protein
MFVDKAKVFTSVVVVEPDSATISDRPIKHPKSKTAVGR